jgi:uncharacterized membrane protein YesL
MKYQFNEKEKKIRKQWLFWMFLSSLIIPILNVLLYFPSDTEESLVVLIPIVVVFFLMFAAFEYYLTYKKGYSWLLTCQIVIFFIAIIPNSIWLVTSVTTMEIGIVLPLILQLLASTLGFSLNMKMRALNKAVKKSVRDSAGTMIEVAIST